MRRLALLCTALMVGLAQPGNSQTAPVANQGFIYGTLTLRSGETQTGFLRWDSEEAYWDDLFHSRQVDLEWSQYADLKALQREKRQQYFKTHGLLDRIAYTLENNDDEIDIRRLFIARFGDLDRIIVDEDENITVEVNDGSVHRIRGYSNDVSGDIIVHTTSEPVTVEWDDVATIEFAEAPRDLTPYAERLYGRVTSSRGDFEGYIQWDESECTSIDVLDSDQEDLPMGDIFAIERERGAGSAVTLADGRELNLSGSNDVGRGHRGVFVETVDQGRVMIPWKRFDRIEFVPGRGSGPNRVAYGDNQPLHGIVVDLDGKTWQGRIVYDLDEARTHDIFNGAHRDLEYDIPFGLIVSIKPHGPEKALVELKSGQVMELGASHDTGETHAGLLVFETESAPPVHVTWGRLKEVRFDQ